MTTIWTPSVRCGGYRVAYGVGPVYQAGRVELIGADGRTTGTIEFRYRGREVDARDAIDLHTSPDSPRGPVRTQIADWLTARGIQSGVEFCGADDPHTGRA